MNDSVLVMMLAEHLLPQVFEVCTVSGQTPFDVARMTYSQLVEWVLMRYAYHMNEMVPNRPKYKEIMARRNAPPYAGGYIHPPKEGIHENIAVFDFRSLYPSIIVSHNISPEKLDCVCCPGKNVVPESQHYYCMRHRGFVPSILNEIVKKRIETQEKMKRLEHGSPEYKRLYNQQFAFKILSNAFYGYFGYPGSRWYSRVCAESITSWGRYYVKDVIRRAEGLGFEVVYGDTDSLFMKVKPKQKKEIGMFVGKVNNSLPGIMELEFKDLYKRGIFMEAKTGAVAKKKYALLDQKDRLVMRGLETRRRDWADIAKDMQERVLMAVLRDASTQKAVQIVRETVQKLKSGKVGKDELTIYTQLTKRISSYEQIGPHVAAAKKMASRGQPVGEGSVISYIIVKGTGSISDRAEPAGDAKDYDPEYYIHHQVIPPALRILSGLGVKEEDLLKEQSSLEKFMKKRNGK
jgi:DNA polymerase I/DNA polymerase-2